ncbi:hypothetical protein WJX81_007717 [Elliptochloris bilobata]|uniref:Fatty acyl-CoA reductase n=1 Tax=Elliptochloris bilobata TaxID=381761 RepID=A0AAW1QDU8_9CHLO
MVKEAELAAFTTPGLPVQGVYAVVADRATLEVFHNLVHQSQALEIQPWEMEHSAEGFRSRRTITYRQAARGPGWFRRLCGSAMMRMSDAHEATYSAPCDTLTFELASYLHLPRGRITTATVRWVQAPVAPDGPDGTRVGSMLRTSQGAFRFLGLQGPLESFFLSEAVHSVERFNALIMLLIHERGLGTPDSLEWAAALLGKDYTALKATQPGLETQAHAGAVQGAALGSGGLDVSDLRATAGLRAVACLGIVIGHMIYWIGLADPDKHKVYGYFTTHAWTVALLNATEPSMDIFLVLTGFLAAASLVPALKASARPGAVIFRYVRRRLLRIVPAYYSALALVRLLAMPLNDLPGVSREAKDAFFTVLPFPTEHCPRRMWANLAFVNNSLAMGGCFGTTWSLAVQMQFYAVFPLLLVLLRPRTPGFRARVAAAAAASYVGAVALRARSVLALRLWEHMPLALLGPHTWQGALLAATALGAAAVVAALRENRFGDLPDPSHRFASPALMGGQMRAALAAPALVRLAAISYDIFLLHPLVILAIFAVLPPSAWFSPSNPLPFLGVTAVVLLASAGAARVHSTLWTAAVARLSGWLNALSEKKDRNATPAQPQAGGPTDGEEPEDYRRIITGQPGSLSVPGAYAGATVLLTGGSGFVGGLCLAALLRSCPQLRRVYVLLRPDGRRGLDAHARLQRLLGGPMCAGLWAGSGGAVLRSKVQAVPGDLAEQGLGLTQSDAALLAAEVNVVLHCAASIAFDAPVQTLLETNYEGTRHVLDLVAGMRCRVAFVQVSSAYANGHLPYGAPVYERLYPLPGTGDADAEAARLLAEWGKPGLPPYCLSKRLAEALVAGRHGGPLRIAIVRPSIVGATAGPPLPGYIGNASGATGVALAIGTGVATFCCHAPSSILDVVPGDHVAAAVLTAGAALMQGAAAGEAPLIVHVGTSACSDPLTTLAFADAAREHFEARPPPVRFTMGRSLPPYTANHTPPGSALFALRVAAASAKFWTLGRPSAACANKDTFLAWRLYNSPALDFDLRFQTVALARLEAPRFCIEA